MLHERLCGHFEVLPCGQRDGFPNSAKKLAVQSGPELTPDDDTPRRVRPVDGPTSWHVSRAAGSTLAGINRADSVFTMLTNRRALISAPLVWTRLRVAALVFVAVTTLGGQRQTQPPRILIESVAGRDSFELYCSPCHGKTGQGDGPVARALTVKPTNLSRLAQRNGGAFPAQRVGAIISGGGRPVPAHGTTDMPIWGPVFGAFESEVRVRERIANVVAHIQSLQLPSSGPNESRRAAVQGGMRELSRRGRPRRWPCCRASAKVASRPHALHREEWGRLSKRAPPPDHRRHRRRAHGDRDMPVWGDAFRTARGGLTPEAAAKRIDAIVRYLGAIQERAGL